MTGPVDRPADGRTVGEEGDAGTAAAPGFRALGAALSNWGRWGPEDERGTLNLVTPERLVAAARLVRTGKLFDLGIPFDEHGPQPGGGRINPVHVMTQTGDRPMGDGASYADDYVFMPLQCATQWDALCHFFYDGRLYNGFPASGITGAGAARLGIESLGRGVVGRGVLLDVAALHGVEWLAADVEIGPGDLEAAERAHSVAVGPGDILCVRTGWRRKFVAEGRAGWMDANPGLGLACARWLHERQVAAVCSDNWGVERFPSGAGTVAPLHCVLIRDLGMPLGEMFDFEALAADCADDGVFEFLFTAPPLKVRGGAGSPVNPLALK